MRALNPAPSVGEIVRILVPVRRHWERTAATVKGVQSHALLVALNGKHRYISPMEALR